MLGKRSFINTYFSKDYDLKPEEKIAKEKKVKAYEKVKASLDKTIQENVEDAVKAIKTFTLSTNDKVPDKININEMLDEEKHLKNILEGKGKIIAIDTETLGDFKDDPANFVMTEFASNEVTFKNGKMDVKTKDRFTFGIPGKMSAYYQNLIAKARVNINLLTENEKWMLGRLSMYSGHFQKIFEKVEENGNSYYGLRELNAPSNKIEDVESGFRNLLRLGNEGQAYTQTRGTKNDKTVYLFNKMKGTIEEANKNNNILLGYNNKVFDNPVINHTMDVGGFYQTKVKNSYDFYEHLQAAHGNHMLALHYQLAEANGVDKSLIPTIGISKLESFIPSTGYKAGLSHEAGNDINWTLKLAFDNFLGNRSIHDDIVERLGHMSSSNGAMPFTQADINTKVFHANKAIPLGPLDFIRDRDGNVKKSYISYGINNGHYYKLDNYYTIEASEVLKNKQLKKALDDAGHKVEGTLHVLSLKEAATNVINTQHTFIIRKSKEELELAIQQSLEVLDVVKSKTINSTAKSVTQKIINDDTAIKVRDNARRAFQAGFEITEEARDGFDFLDKMYSAHSELDTIYQDHVGAGKKISDTKLRKLITDGKVEIADGIIISSDILEKAGISTYEKKEKFYELFHVLDDTKNTIGKAVFDIKEAITPSMALFSLDEKHDATTKTKYTNIKRTMAIRDYHERLKASIKEYKLSALERKRIREIRKEAAAEMMRTIENERQKKASYLFNNYNNEIKKIFKSNTHLQGIKPPTFEELLGNHLQGVHSDEYLAISANKELIYKRIKELRENGLSDIPIYKSLTARYNQIKEGTITGAAIDTYLEEFQRTMIELPNEFQTKPKKQKFMNIATHRINRLKEFNLEKAREKINREVGNMRIKDITISDLNYVGFKYNGEVIKINSASPTTAISSLYGEVRKITGNIPNEIVRKQEEQKVFSGMISALFKQDIINRKDEKLALRGLEEKAFKEIKDGHALATYIATKLFNITNEAKLNISEETLKNPDSRKIELEDYLAMKEDIRKGIRDPKNFTIDEELEILASYRRVQVTEPVYEFNGNGYKIGNSNLDAIEKSSAFQKFVAEEGHNLNTISSVSDIRFYGANELRQNKYKLDDVTIDLFKKFGYDDHQIKHLERHLFDGVHGIAGKHSLTVAIHTMNDDGVEKLFMSISNPENSGHMANAIMKGELPTKAANLEFSRIWHWDNGLKTVKQQSSHKVIAKEASVYAEGGKNTKGVAKYKKLKMEIVDTVERGMDKTFIESQMMARLIKNNEFEEATKVGNKKLHSPINEGIGAVGTFVLDDEKGAIKTFLPAPADYESAKLIKTESMVNFVPFLYDYDKEFKEFVDKSMKPYGSKNAEEFIKKWKKEIDVYHYKDFSGEFKLELTQAHEFITNILQGQKFIEKLASYTHLLHNEKSGEAIRELAQKELNQVVKEHNGIELGYVREGNSLDNIPFSVSTDSTRPTMLQKLNAHAIVVTDYMSGHKHNELVDRNISIGADITTRRWQNNIAINNIPEETLNLMDKRVRAFVENNKLERELTGNMAVLSTKEVADKLSKVSVGEILVKTGRDVNHAHYVQEALEKFKIIAPTFEQHALINPYLYFEFFNTHELLSHNIGKDFVFHGDLTHHSEVQPGQVIGHYYDEKGRMQKVKNPSKEIATIEGMADGKLYFRPVTPIINDIKVNYGGAEKSVASIASNKEHFRDIYQAIWDVAFGKNISLIANPEMGKHETGTLIFGSPLMKIADKVKQANDKDLTNEFISTMNKAFGAEAIGVSYFDGIKKLVSTNKIGEDTSFDEATMDVINHFKTKEGFKDILDDTKADPISGISNDQIKRVTISKGEMSESHSSQSGTDDVLGKGVQIDDRLLQTTDLFFNKEDVDGMYTYDDEAKKFVHNIDSVKDELRTLAKDANLHDVGIAVSDASNIVHATRKIIDGNYGNALTKEIHFNQINMLPKGGLSASDLEKTIFDKDFIGKETNVIKVNLPKGITVRNPITNKDVDHFIIPVLNTHEVKGETFLSSTHKSVADLLRKVNDVQHNNTNKNMKEALADISKSYQNVIKSYQFELADKEGILYRHALKNRVPFSGQLLAQSVVPLEQKLDKEGKAILDEHGKPIYDFVEGIGIKDAIVKKGEKTLYNDIIEVSDKALINMGINFKNIGKDLQANKFHMINSDVIMQDLINKDIYDTHHRFKGQTKLNFLEHLKNNMPARNDVDAFLKSNEYGKVRNGFGGVFNQIFKSEEEFVDLLKHGNIKRFAETQINSHFGYAFAEIGKTFMEKKGLNEILIRYPTFLGTSNFVANIRLNRNMEGMVARVAGYTAKKLNLDIDADRLSNILIGSIQKRGKHLNFEIEDSNTKRQKKLKRIYEAQAIYNGKPGVGVGMDKSWVEKTVEANMDAHAHTKDFTTNIHKYIEMLKEQHVDDPEAFKFRYDTKYAKELGVHARLGKGTIGLISNPSFFLRNAAQSVYQKQGKEGLEKLGEIVAFTSLAEQKPIDSKHIKTFSDGIPAVNYGKAMDLMASGNPNSVKEGSDLLVQTLKDMNLAKNKPEMQEQLDKAVSVIKDLFSNKEARDIYNSELMGSNKHPQGYKVFNSKGKVIEDNTYDFLKNIVYHPENITKSDLTKGHINMFSGFIEDINKDLIVHNKKISNDTTLFLNEKNNVGMEAGAYRISEVRADETLPKVTMVKLDKELKETGETFDIFGKSMIDVSNKINTNFDNTNQIANSYYQDSLKDFDTFVRSKAIAEHAAGDGSIETANAIINKYKINDMTGKELFNHVNAMNDVHKQEVANAFNIHYNTEHGSNVERFTKEVQSMKGKYYSGEAGGKLIQQFNEAIKKEGASYDRTRRHIISNQLMDSKNYEQRYIDNILTNVSKQAPNIKYGENGEPRDIIRRIEGTRLYDLEDARERLEKNLQDNLPNISQEIKNAYGDSTEELARHEMVERPLLDKVYENNEARLKLTDNYADLLSTNFQEAYTRLDWDKPINEVISMQDDKALDVLGNSKISYGPFVNKRINEVSPELLLDMQESVAKSNKLYDSMAETNSRINAYLNIIKDKKIDIPTSETTEMFSNARIEKNTIDNISDINEAIKKAGARKRVSTNTELIESAKDIGRGIEEFIKKDKIKTLAIAAAAIGITTAFLGYQYTANANLLTPESRPNGSGAPAPDGTYDDNGISIQHPHTAPPSSAMVGTNNGVKYDISGKGNVSDKHSLYNAIQHVIRKGNSDISVTVNENDNTSSISDNWIMDKVSKLIGR